MQEADYTGKETGTQDAVCVAAFYRFFPFAGYAQWRAPLLALMNAQAMRGTILLAPEGINGTVSGSAEAMGALLAEFARIPGVGDMPVKRSTTAAHPFGKAKVRLKKELIPLGVDCAPDRLTGIRATAEQWNALIADPATYVLDARNDYEVHVGTFRGAVNPETRTFRELPAFVERNLDPEKHPRIATFCTGGIRCEKLTSWLLERGFKEVYQLEGGILKYLEDIPKEQSLWQGECYVFDERVAVDHALGASEDASMCTACGHPLLPEDRLDTLYKEGESCPYCA